MNTSPLLLFVAVAALGATSSGAQRPRRASKPKLRIPQLAKRNCANDLAKRDCRAAKKHGYCYVYGNKCEETCGCNYDLAAARKKKKLDDAYYESPDFQCKKGNEFKDYMKFDCALYEGAKWCQVDAKGDVVEGPGWCSWFNPANCDIERDMRWPDHAGYANKDGQWAKSCCCNTDLADTYQYEGKGECVDLLNSQDRTWHDKNGYSCRAYHFGNFCTLEGKAGTGWDLKEYGPIKNYAHDGMSPLEACCTCGGSSMSSPSVTSAPTTYSPTSFPTYSPSASEASTDQDATETATSRL